MPRGIGTAPKCGTGVSSLSRIKGKGDSPLYSCTTYLVCENGYLETDLQKKSSCHLSMKANLFNIQLKLQNVASENHACITRPQTALMIHIHA